MKSRLALFLSLLFVISIFAPLSSAAGMVTCTIGGGICDDWNKAHDGTANQQDWIEGIYEFDLIDTSTINMEMSWALHEFNRTTLGLTGLIPGGGGITFEDALEDNDTFGEGMSPFDGAPADLIRNYFDSPLTPTITVKEKLIMEVNDSIQELLDSGFGTVNSISTTYTDSISNSGITTTCSEDPTMDSAEENPSLSNNVFDPPICFSVTASVTLSTSTFNLGSVDPLTLDRVYRGMLVMGSDITSEFDLFSDPGHKSVFVINPPDFATVKGVDSLGVQIVRSGPPSYMAAQWSIDNRDAPFEGERISQTVAVEIGHRNSTQTNSFEASPQDTGVTLDVTLDLSDESSAWIDIVAGINHLDQSTMDDWGVSLVDVTQNAKVPWVTSDGIRLAYQNDLIELDDFTNNFPMGNIGDSIEDAVPGVGNIEINSPTWVSQSIVLGIPEPSGGLNHTHNDCPESLPPGTEVNYCIEGPNAMDGSHPVYLRATSDTFNLSLLDLVKQEVNDPTGIIDVIEESDMRKLLDAGLTIETQFGEDLLQNMIPDNLPPTELTLELILPMWMQAATGDSSITLIQRTNGVNDLSISMAGPSAYRPDHAILDSNDEEICSADEVDWTCINLDVDTSISNLDFNEWGPSIELTASLTATIDVYRIKIPDEVVDLMKSGDTTVTLEVIPSDLIRLGFDITDRLAEPMSKDVNIVEGEETSFDLTTSGLQQFVKDLGKDLTKSIHESSAELGSQDDFTELDLTGFQVITSLENLGGIGSTFGDETPIRLKVRIPEFTLKAGVTNGWGGIMDGDPTIGVTTVFHSPIITAANSFSNALTTIGTQFVQMGGSGMTLDNNGEAFNFKTESQDLDLNSIDERLPESELKGEITFLLPEGITLENFQTANGWEKTGTEDGRQKITISLESFIAGDEFTFSIQVSWWYIFSQIWIYPAILLSLVVWRVRARRKKKRRKNEAGASTKVISDGKGGLSNSDFAALSAGDDQTLSGNDDFGLYGRNLDDDDWD
tara:strand:+ start:26 stop:3049 length:3024 start_codon:yes stop_codon:yes gene_type:complete